MHQHALRRIRTGGASARPRLIIWLPAHPDHGPTRSPDPRQSRGHAGAPSTSPIKRPASRRPDPRAITPPRQEPGGEPARPRLTAVTPAHPDHPPTRSPIRPGSNHTATPARPHVTNRPTTRPGDLRTRGNTPPHQAPAGEPATRSIDRLIPRRPGHSHTVTDLPWRQSRDHAGASLHVANQRPARRQPAHHPGDHTRRVKIRR